MYALQRMNGGKLRGEKPAIAILHAHILKQRTPCTSSRLQLDCHLQYNTKIFAKNIQYTYTYIIIILIIILLEYTKQKDRASMHPNP
jgi:hypothetical protein